MSIPGFERTSLQLYRDCLRLVQHVAPGRQSAKQAALRQMVRHQFDQHRQLTDQEKILAAQNAAIRALSNYLLLTSRDPHVAAAMRQQTAAQAQELQKQQTAAAKDGRES